MNRLRKNQGIQTPQINNLSFIPPAIFIISQVVYNNYHISKSVSWAIFYFSAIYFVLIITALIEMMRAKDSLSKLYYLGYGMGLVLLIYMEISSRIAKTELEEEAYREYMQQVNSKENALLFTTLMIFVMITLLKKLWKK